LFARSHGQKFKLFFAKVKALRKNETQNKFKGLNMNPGAALRLKRSGIANLLIDNSGSAK